MLLNDRQLRPPKSAATHPHPLKVLPPNAHAALAALGARLALHLRSNLLLVSAVAILFSPFLVGTLASLLAEVSGCHPHWARMFACSFLGLPMEGFLRALFKIDSWGILVTGPIGYLLIVVDGIWRMAAARRKR